MSNDLIRQKWVIRRTENVNFSKFSREGFLFFWKPPALVPFFSQRDLLSTHSLKGAVIGSFSPGLWHISGMPNVNCNPQRSDKITLRIEQLFIKFWHPWTIAFHFERNWTIESVEKKWSFYRTSFYYTGARSCQNSQEKSFQIISDAAAWFHNLLGKFM